MSIIKTSRLSSHGLVALVAFETEVFLELGLCEDDTFKNWVKGSLRKLAAKLRSQRRLSLAKRKFLNKLVEDSMAWMVQVMHSVTIINAQFNN